MITDVSRVTGETTKKSPEEVLQFVETGMNLAGHVITDPHLQELLRQLAHHEISFEEYDAATTQHIMGRA